MKKDKIIVWGYWAGNLGDDLFLNILCSRYPKTNFIILCDEKYSKAFKCITNLFIVKDLKDVRDSIFLQIFLGGSIFMQPNDEQQIELKFLDVTKYGLLINIPYIVIGANFGPYNHNKHLSLYKEWFRKAKDICFRDLWSKNQFPSLKNIRWAPDIILGQYEIFNNLHISRQENVISISLIKNTKRIGLPNYSEKNYLLLLQTIQKYIENGYRIQLLSFCPKQGDTMVAKEILEMVAPTNRDVIKIIEYKGNIKTFIEKSYACEYMIGTRFHSVIIAWTLGRSVLPIAYNDKMLHVLKDYNFPYKHLDITKLNNVTYEEIDGNRLVSPWYCKNLKVEALRQFDYLDKIIDEEI